MKPGAALRSIRILHTAAWALFAGCILALPVAAHLHQFKLAVILIGVVGIEIAILAVNRWACPLTAVAARYTSDRSANFDIFLPLWVARYNKPLFGSLFLAGLIYTAVQWF